MVRMAVAPESEQGCQGQQGPQGHEGRHPGSAIIVPDVPVLVLARRLLVLNREFRLLSPDLNPTPQRRPRPRRRVDHDLVPAHRDVARDRQRVDRLEAGVGGEGGEPAREDHHVVRDGGARGRPSSPRSRGCRRRRPAATSRPISGVAMLARSTIAVGEEVLDGADVVDRQHGVRGARGRRASGRSPRRSPRRWRRSGRRTSPPGPGCRPWARGSRRRRAPPGSPRSGERQAEGGRLDAGSSASAARMASTGKSGK